MPSFGHRCHRGRAGKAGHDNGAQHGAGCGRGSERRRHHGERAQTPGAVPKVRLPPARAASASCRDRAEAIRAWEYRRETDQSMRGASPCGISTLSALDRGKRDHRGHPLPGPSRPALRTAQGSRPLARHPQRFPACPSPDPQFAVHELETSPVTIWLRFGVRRRPAARRNDFGKRTVTPLHP